MPIVDGGLCQSPEKAFNSSFSYLCIYFFAENTTFTCLSSVPGRGLWRHWEESGKVRGGREAGKHEKGQMYFIMLLMVWKRMELNHWDSLIQGRGTYIYIYIYPTHLSLVEDWPCRHLFSRAPSFICSRLKQRRVGRQRTPSGKEEKVLQLEARLAQTDGWGWEAMAVVLVAICHSSFLAPLRCIFDLWWVYSPLLCSLQICGSGYSAG